ncbi:MAG: methyltransferase domain-containing protein [Bacteroidetes bacterium]|nr:MAG: methyltransferase domain-containing protein [Bacteroidota bacterium]
MKNAEEIKNLVKEKYSAIAEQTKSANESSCCGSTCCGPEDMDYTVFSDDYTQLDGYNEDADLGLGCGLPTEYAKIKKGDTVVDLGSGAGNDCFVARAETGAEGRVIGVDMTETMVDKARENAKKVGFDNVEFILGELESNPLPDNTADVAVSNCVFNLVPDKLKAFQETYRILKPGGHFSISDVVLRGELPEGLKNDAEMYAGCVAGALQQDEYLDVISKAGFTQVEVQKEKEVKLPDEILLNYLSEKGLENYKNSGIGIYSITVFGKK